MGYKSESHKQLNFYYLWFSIGRHQQANKTQPNPTQPNLTQPNQTQPNPTQPNETKRNQTKVYQTKHKLANKKCIPASIPLFSDTDIAKFPKLEFSANQIC